jgi:flavodoxin
MECTEVAKDELNDNARPELKEYLEDISEYDIIYLGFPNWWSTLPMPVWTQLEKLNFEGKTIKPFVTHEGSGFGRSESDIKKLCPGAKIKKGLSIQGSFVKESEDKVKIWINE